MTDHTMGQWSGVVNADAFDHAQQAVQWQGIQHNHFHVGAPETRPGVVLDTLVPPPDLVGRAAELAELRAVRRDAQASGRPVVVSAVHGMGGAGKTALVRTLAADVAADFPDGRIEVDLCGFTPGKEPREPGEVLGELLNLVGFTGVQVPTQTEIRSQVWRAWLAGRRVLLVLDNARDAAQVAPLLPSGGGAGGCLVLVTSRDRLDEVDATAWVGVDTLQAADAVALLLSRARRTLTEMRTTSAELENLARLCGFLPLALRPVGSLLRDASPAELIAGMRSPKYPLQHLAKADQAAAAAFTVSYNALGDQLQSTLRACAWHPGPDFNAGSIAALTSLPRPLATVHMAELLQRSMLTGLPQGRYTFHDLFLGYTRRHTEAHDLRQEPRQPRVRLFAHLRTHLLIATDILKLGDQQVTRLPHAPDIAADFTNAVQALSWLTAATDELIATAYAALGESWEHATDLGYDTARWLVTYGRLDQAHTLYITLYDTSDRYGQAKALRGVGDVARMRGIHERAAGAFRQALQISQQIGDRYGQAYALNGLGDVARMRGELERAAGAFRQALQISRQIGDRYGQANALRGTGDVARIRGIHEEAADAFQ